MSSYQSLTDNNNETQFIDGANKPVYPPPAYPPPAYPPPAYPPPSYPSSQYEQPNSSGSGYTSSSPDQVDFSWLSPTSILRYVELLTTLLCFAILSTIQHYDDLAQCEVMVIVGSCAFVYCLFDLAFSAFQIKSRFLPNLDIWQFAFDFLFTILLFFSSMSMAIKCNKTAVNDIPFCELLTRSDDTTSLSKSRASAAFGFLSSFLFVASTVFTYRRLVASRSH